MTTFLLIRHGHTALVGKALVGRHTGVSLSEAGHVQAHQLVRRLASTSIDAVYSSPLQRSIETAQPLASQRNLPVIERDRLAEIDFGQWTGATIAELEPDPEWRRFNSFRSSARALKGESILDLQSRMMTELEELRLRHPEQAVALFSHGELIRSAIIHYAAIPIDLSLRIEISPASISVIGLAEWGVRILAVNDTGAYTG